MSITEIIRSIIIGGISGGIAGEIYRYWRKKKSKKDSSGKK